MIGEAGSFSDFFGFVIFLPGCDLACDYCLNTDIVENNLPTRISLEDVLRHAKENAETNILISGGEPLLHHQAEELIRKLKDAGLRVGLSTNGNHPYKLQNLIEKKHLDFCAIDIKHPHTKQGIESAAKNLFRSNIEAAESYADNVKKSIQVVSDKPLLLEFRTTLYPPVVASVHDIVSIGTLLPKRSLWTLQQFRPRLGLLGGPSIATVQAHPRVLVEEMREEALKYVERVELRDP